MPYKIDMTQRGALPAAGPGFQHAAIAWASRPEIPLMTTGAGPDATQSA